MPGSYTLTYSAADAAGNVGSAERTVNVVDSTPPDISVPSDALFALITNAHGEHVNFGGDVSITDDVDPSPTLDCVPPSGSLFAPGTTDVTCTGTDASGNSASADFEVFVGYGGSDGINPNRTSQKRGRMVRLYWAWQDDAGHNVDSSFDPQQLRIFKCHDPSYVVVNRTGVPGSGGFRIQSGNVWEYKWRTGWDDDDSDDDDNGYTLPKGNYCATVESVLTGQEMESPTIRLY